VDNKGVIKDVHRTINAQTPTYDLLSPEFDILQAIRTKLNELPDKQTPSTGNPPGGLDCSRHGSPVPMLLYFMVNIKLPKASLRTFGMQLTHQPVMKEYLIRHSHVATGRETSWDNTTYESIDWRHYGESFKKLSHGRRIQISKYTNDLLPTK
jgi:hypothetical protein